MIKIKFNTKSFEAETRNIQGRVLSRLDDVVYQGGQRLLNETHFDVPVSTGKLVISGKVNKISGAPSVYQTVEYSSLDRGYDYAWIQHERDFDHPYPGVKWHYLSDSVEKNRPSIIGVWAFQIDKVLMYYKK